MPTLTLCALPAGAAYLLADTVTKEAVLIDPVLEMADRDVRLVEELGLTLKYGINTHCHADHVTGTGAIKTHIPCMKSGISAASGAKADFYFKHLDVIRFGVFEITVLATPGHTDGCCTFVCEAMAFTGDAMLIRGCGRTDFQSGSAERLFDSVHNHIFTLPDDTIVYPGHDYKGLTSSTVGEEKRLNPRLTKAKPDFIAFMAALNLPYPKRIDVALPANMVCGIQDDMVIPPCPIDGFVHNSVHNVAN